MKFLFLLLSTVVGGFLAACHLGLADVDFDMPIMSDDAGSPDNSSSEFMTASDRLNAHQELLADADREQLQTAMKFADVAERAEVLHGQSPNLQEAARQEAAWLEESRQIASAMIADYQARLARNGTEPQDVAGISSDMVDSWHPVGVAHFRTPTCRIVPHRVEMNQYGDLRTVTDQQPVDAGSVIWDHPEARHEWAHAVASQ